MTVVTDGASAAAAFEPAFREDNAAAAISSTAMPLRTKDRRFIGLSRNLRKSPSFAGSCAAGSNRRRLLLPLHALPPANPALQQHQCVVGREPDRGEHRDRREHQRDLKIVL